MGNRHLHVDILSIFFGIGTWLCVNGLWVELPLLVQQLPEGWTLPSYMAVIIQLSNFGPIMYTLLHSFFPKIVTEKRSIYAVMTVGLIAVLLLAQFWMEVIPVFGQPHSVALFVLVFIMASVDCSSRVLYLPFMAHLKPEYLTSFFIGEGLSGFVPSIFALVQGAGGGGGCVNKTIEDENGTATMIITSGVPPDPLFSVEVFFYLMTFVTFLSVVAFYFLNCQSVVGKSLVVDARINTNQGQGDILLRSPVNKFYNSTPPLKSDRNVSSKTAAVDKLSPSIIASPNDVENTLLTVPLGKSYDEDAVSKAEFVYLMVLLSIICSLANGVFPSIQSYSCLPYGNVTYHWTVTLSNMANPAVCFLTFFLRPPNKSLVTIMSGASIIVGCYVLYTALMSPFPPMVGTFWGEVLLIASWIFLVGLFTYVKVSIAIITRAMGKQGLFWTGAFTQLGSSVGAITAFLIVNYGNVFHSFNPCG